jgi:serine protease AprX
MSDKYLVTLRSADDASKVRAAKCEILAEYPDTLLVRCNDAQKKRLQKANLEMSAIESPAVTTTGMSFAMSSAVEAEAVTPVEIDQSRTAYYLIQLAGPPTAEWLQAIKTAGGQIYGTLAGYTYLIGILPAGVQNLSREPWVEAVTPYRPAMKVSPQLRPGVSRNVGVSELESVTIDAPEAGARKQIEVNVFPNESTANVAAKIRESGGTVISETPTTVVASVAPNTITEVANEPGVQAILPFSFPEFHNDRATVAMGAAANRVLRIWSCAEPDKLSALPIQGSTPELRPPFTMTFAGELQV